MSDGREPLDDHSLPPWTGNEICMIFDGETGNALDSFDYTAEELQRRADFMAGKPAVTMEPSPHARLG